VPERRHRPLHGLFDTFSELNRMREHWREVEPTPEARTHATAWVPSLDVFAQGDDLVLRCELAGVGRDDVDPADRLRDGSAMDVWRRMIAAQGGDPDAPLPEARESHIVSAPAGGTLTRLDALGVGVAAWRLGAGRSRPGESVQAGAGVVLHAKPGDAVAEGAPLMTLHTDEPARFERALAALDGSFDIDADGGPAPDATGIVIDRLG
jgi:thymidine phosphorylase